MLAQLRDRADAIDAAGSPRRPCDPSPAARRARGRDRCDRSPPHGDALRPDGRGSTPTCSRWPRSSTLPSPSTPAWPCSGCASSATMLDQATTRFREGLAHGRTPARINIDRSLNQIDGYLSSPMDRTCSRAAAGRPTGTARRRGGKSCSDGGAGRRAPRVRPLSRHAGRRAASRRPAPMTSAGSAGSPTARRSTPRSSGSTPGVDSAPRRSTPSACRR